MHNTRGETCVAESGCPPSGGLVVAGPAVVHSTQNHSPLSRHTQSPQESAGRTESPSWNVSPWYEHVTVGWHGTGTQLTTPPSVQVQLSQLNLDLRKKVSFAFSSLEPCWHSMSGPKVTQAISVQETSPPVTQVQVLQPSSDGKLVPCA